MKTSVKEISPVKKKLVVEVESKEVNKKFNKVYRDLGKKARIPGFRPGKIPRTILERRFGKQVTEDVTRALVNETLPKALEETEIFPLSIPAVENENLKTNQNFNYSAILEVRPEIELKDYKGIEVEKEISSVTDEDVKKELELIQKNQGQLKAIEQERGIREEDYVIIDYEGFEGDLPIEGIKASDFLLNIGSNEFHPDFEKGLIGLKRGDATELRVVFDDDHHHSLLAGKTVNFKVKVTEIKEMELPELNDEFAGNLGGDFNDLKELQQKLKEEITKREDTRIDHELKKRILDKISATVDFELPESLVESEIQMAIENIQQNLLRAGSNMEKAGLKVERLREEFRPTAEKRVKEMLILGETARRDGLTIDETELSEGFKKMALNIGQDQEVIRKYYEANNLVDSLRQKLLEEKTLNFLMNNANISEVEADKINRKGE